MWFNPPNTPGAKQHPRGVIKRYSAHRGVIRGPTCYTVYMKVILLAAGVGRRFGRRTKKIPKCLIPLGHGETLLKRYFRSFRSVGLREVVLVVGHKKEMIMSQSARIGRGLKIRFVDNDEYTKGSVLSLFNASHELNDDCFIMDADVYFPTEALRRLVRSKHRSSFLVDTRSHFSGEEMMVMSKKKHPVRIAKKVDPSLKVLGESVGFLKVGKADATLLKKILKSFIRHGKTGVEYEDSYNVLMQKTTLGAEPITGFWTEMDFEEDLRKIRDRSTGNGK